MAYLCAIAAGVMSLIITAMVAISFSEVFGKGSSKKQAQLLFFPFGCIMLGWPAYAMAGFGEVSFGTAALLHLVISCFFVLALYSNPTMGEAYASATMISLAVSLLTPSAIHMYLQQRDEDNLPQEQEQHSRTWEKARSRMPLLACPAAPCPADTDETAATTITAAWDRPAEIDSEADNPIAVVIGRTRRALMDKPTVAPINKDNDSVCQTDSVCH